MVLRGRLVWIVWVVAWTGASAQGGMATLRLGIPPGGKSPASAPAGKPAQILRCQGGQGVARFDLSGLPKGAKIYRADLLVFRTSKVTGADEEALADIEIYPLFSDFRSGGKPDVSGKALALRAPWYDRFDATEAVRQWTAGKPNGGLFVKVCPLWDAGATCLDVAYEGKPETVPPQVKGLGVFHRAGQTFITWREADPLIKSDKTTWGEIKRKLAEARGSWTYRVYAHDRPIDAGTIAEAELLAEVGPLSGHNCNGRNAEYLIAQALIQPDEIGELSRNHNGYMYSWHMDHPRMDRYPMARFVIEEKAGPLPVGMGLYVHSPAALGKRYYAVVSCRDGVENTRDFSDSNALAQPVQEVVGPGEPVLQGEGLWGPYFDYPGRRKVYVQWAAPPLSPRPNMYFNWSVLVPPDLDGEAPAELYLHAGNFSYAKPRKKYILGSVQIGAHDWPSSGWYGFHESYGTLKSYKTGTVGDHTHRRIVAFLEWAKKHFPIDPERVICVGGDGAALLGLHRPELFAYVLVQRFGGGVLNPKSAPTFAAAWGPKSPQIKGAAGRANWGWAMPDEVVLSAPNRRLPLMVCAGPSWGCPGGYGKAFGPFYSAMQRVRQPLIAGHGWDCHLVRPDKHTGLWRGLDLRRSSVLPAFANSSSTVEHLQWGNVNYYHSWKDVADTPDGLEITITGYYRDQTFDTTPRRLRNFKVEPGEKVRWEATSTPTRRVPKPPVQRGQAVVDHLGLFTIERLKINGGATLTVKVTREM